MLRFIFLTLTTLLIVRITSFAESKYQERILCNEWKLTLAQIDKTNIPPRFDDLRITFKQQKNSYQILVNDSVSQKGIWELDTKAKKVLLHDVNNNIIHSLDINFINKKQISIQDFQFPEITLFLSPAENRKQQKLSSQEHLLCRTWSISKSADKDNLGTVFDFSPNNQFIIYAFSEGNHFEGEWKLDQKNKTLILKDFDNNKTYNLKIKSLTNNQITLYNPTTQKENTLINEETIEKDKSGYKKLALISIPLLLLLLSPSISTTP